MLLTLTDLVAVGGGVVPRISRPRRLPYSFPCPAAAAPAAFSLTSMDSYSFSLDTIHVCPV